jgi:hypothetical protein
MTFDVESRKVDLPFPLVAEETLEALRDCHARAGVNYRAWKRQFLQWLYYEGKDPERRRGYSP